MVGSLFIVVAHLKQISELKKERKNDPYEYILYLHKLRVNSIILLLLLLLHNLFFLLLALAGFFICFIFFMCVFDNMEFSYFSYVSHGSFIYIYLHGLVFFRFVFRILFFFFHRKRIYIWILHSTKRQDQRDLLFSYIFKRLSALMWKTVCMCARSRSSSSSNSSQIYELNLIKANKHIHTQHTLWMRQLKRKLSTKEKFAKEI